jgi:hypothetical protein
MQLRKQKGVEDDGQGGKAAEEQPGVVDDGAALSCFDNYGKKQIGAHLTSEEERRR